MADLGDQGTLGHAGVLTRGTSRGLREEGRILLYWVHQALTEGFIGGRAMGYSKGATVSGIRDDKGPLAVGLRSPPVYCLMDPCGNSEQEKRQAGTRATAVERRR